MGTLETRQKVEAAISALFELKSVEDSVEEQGLSRSTFYKYLSENPDLSDMYERAQQARAEMYADQIIRIADTSSDPQTARNQIDARKWYASKAKPNKFGDRVDLNVNGSIDILAALEAGKQRALLPSSYSTEAIDAEFNVIKQKVLTGTTGSKPAVDQEPGMPNEGEAESHDPNPLD